MRPNPANGHATVTFELDGPCHPELVVVDAAGRTVARIDAGPRAAGRNTIAIDAAGLPSGRYFMRLDGCGQPGTTTVAVVR